MSESPLNAALRQFEAVEANLVKAEKVLQAIDAAVPQGIAFGESTEYEQDCRDFQAIFDTLPKIDGWKPDVCVMGLDEIAQCRFDAQEVGEIECIVSVENQIAEPSKQLREYRYRFNRKRRELIRDSLNELIDTTDGLLRELSQLLESDTASHKKVDSESFESLKQYVAQIAMLLGSSVAKPPRWSDLHRHLSFGLLGDLHDIVEHDWPAVKAGLRKSMYGEKEPVPIEIEDIGAIVSSKPRGPVATRLKWEILSDDDFERLLFTLTDVCTK